MSASFIALIGYIGWTTLLLLSLEVFRTILVVKAKRAANSFNPSGDDTTPFGHRLTRAHANCYESFPIIGGCLLASLATANVDITDSLALYVLAARVAQTLVHLISGSVLAAQIRFVFFSIQIFICIIWMVDLTHLILS